MLFNVCYWCYVAVNAQKVDGLISQAMSHCAFEKDTSPLGYFKESSW